MKPIIKTGFPGGTEWHMDGWLLMMIAIIACGLFVSLAVENIQEANADKSEHHKHYCSAHNADPANCIPDEDSKGGENTKDETRAEQMEKDTEEQMDEINEQILEQKKIIEKAEKDILNAKKKSQEANIKMIAGEQNIKILKLAYYSTNHDITAKKKELRAWVMPTNATGDSYAERKILQQELQDLRDKYDEKFDDYKQAVKDQPTLKDDYWDSVDAIQDTKDKWQEEVDKLNELKLSFKQLLGKTNLISIVISRTCEMTIKSHWEAEQLDPDHYNGSKCLSYRDLVQFDNTIKAISGEFEDLGYDLNRKKPGIQKTHEYYKQFPWWKVITVDPDGNFISNSAVITVQPQDVKYIKTIGQSNKDESIDFDKMERYVYHDVIISEDCKYASVSPKIEAVKTAVEHFMKNCTPPKSDWEIFSTIKLVALEGLGVVDEQSKVAMNWFSEKAREIAGMT